MFGSLKLLLPALVPSWRFFDVIAPSPRIEFSLLDTQDAAAESWQEMRLRPCEITAWGTIRSLFWSPARNEDLFLFSCAERLMENPSEHSQREIVTRIQSHLQHIGVAEAYFQFRLLFLMRDGDQIGKHITFISPIYPCYEEARL